MNQKELTSIISELSKLGTQMSVIQHDYNIISGQKSVLVRPEWLGESSEEIFDIAEKLLELVPNNDIKIENDQRTDNRDA